MNWFRLYSETLNDPKVQRMPAELFRSWINILCIASEQKTRGILPPIHDIAYYMRIDEESVGKILNDLISRELIDRMPNGDLTPHAWNKRQYVSDVSTTRVKKFREKQEGNVSETFQVNAERNAPETETETDTDYVRAQKSPEPLNPILEAVLDVTGERLNFEMGSLTAIKRQEIFKCVGLVEREGDCARDVQEWGRVLFPKSRNKSPADCNPPTVKQFLDEYQKVKRRFASRGQPKPTVTYEDFIAGKFNSRDISHELAKEYTERYTAQREKT